MTHEAVLLDLDDTLYSYPECNEAGKRAAWREARERGYDLGREAFEELYQTGRRAVKRELAGTASAHERVLYFKRGIESYADSHSARDALALGEAYWESYVAEMSLFDGVAETLAALDDSGVDVALVSNLTTRIQLEKIDRLGIEEHLDLVVTSEETGREKPSSAMFTLPLAELDRRPSEALVVGDDPATDVEGGNAVGLTTVLFNGSADGEADYRQPDHRIDDFRELLDLL